MMGTCYGTLMDFECQHQKSCPSLSSLKLKVVYNLKEVNGNYYLKPLLYKDITKFKANHNEMNFIYNIDEQTS